MPKTLSEIVMSVAEGTLTAVIDNFINAIKITKGEINGIPLVIKHQTEIRKLILSLIMHFDNFSSTAALKTGLVMERHAKLKYQSMQSKYHKGMKLISFWSIILEKYPFIAASLDCLVIFESCDDDLLEVKPPQNTRDEKKLESKIWTI